MQYHSNSEAETRKIGLELAKKMSPGTIATLHGELGAGKTTLVKGIAKGLGVKEEITSPTFTLMNVYQTKMKSLKLVHIDTYRLKYGQELVDIGVEEYLGTPDAICIIEWPEKLTTLLENRKAITITLQHASESERKIEML